MQDNLFLVQQEVPQFMRRGKQRDFRTVTLRYSDLPLGAVQQAGRFKLLLRDAKRQFLEILELNTEHAGRDLRIEYFYRMRLATGPKAGTFVPDFPAEPNRLILDLTLPGFDQHHISCGNNSAADPDVAAGGAVVAAVPADERGVAALRALRAQHDRNVLWRRRFQDAHLLPRGAVFVEDAEHGVAVQHQPRHVGNRRGEGLLLAAAGDEGHEVAERLGKIEQLAQLHADPRRVEHAHVERQDLAQAVERARVFAREPHRVGPRDAVGQGDFLQAQDEIVAGARVEHVHGPGHRAVGAGFRLLQREHRFGDWRRADFRSQFERFIRQARVQLVYAPAHDLREGRDERGHALSLAARRERHVEGIAARLGKRIELEFQPALVVGAHVHG